MFKHFRDCLKNSSEFDTNSYVNMAKEIIREHEKQLSYCALNPDTIKDVEVENNKEIYALFSLNRLF
jgi:hypothetical protein